MTETKKPSSPDDAKLDTDPIHHASFVLRCWKTDVGRFCARLTDVRSGITHPVADLAELARLLRRLLELDSGESSDGAGRSY